MGLVDYLAKAWLGACSFLGAATGSPYIVFILTSGM